jgi:outer membrane lipase/esterase
MRQINFVLSLVVAATLASCGGDEPFKNKLRSQITFGDSLSDVGTYAVGGVAQMGGGKYNINGDNTAINAALTGKNWTELLAEQLHLPAPCAAQTGLDGDANANPNFNFSVPVVNHAGCLSYAQGGARVTEPVGPGNKLAGSALGLLTVPVATQIERHLTLSAGRFSAGDAVFVLAGANDVFVQLATVAASGATPGEAVAAMASAGAELAALVNTRIVANGATRVIAINLPDIVKTPFGQAQDVGTQGLITAMTQAFNDQLQAGLGREAKVLLVDLYTRSQAQAANPAQYGLTNVSTPACDLTPAQNALGSSLVCNGTNLIAGDVSHYAFSDTVHLTPYNYALLSNFVETKMTEKGWF